LLNEAVDLDGLAGGVIAAHVVSPAVPSYVPRANTTPLDRTSGVPKIASLALTTPIGIVEQILGILQSRLAER